MSTIEMVMDFLFFGLLGFAIYTGWNLIRKIDAYLKSIPELKKTMTALNASILNAEGTIAKLGKIPGVESHVSRVPPANNNIRGRNPVATKATLPTKLSGLIDMATKQKKA